VIGLPAFFRSFLMRPVKPLIHARYCQTRTYPISAAY
jgi:predicted alpha/beta superfamily hydrolase